MNPQQRRRAAAKRTYARQRIAYLDANPRCAIKAPGCSGRSTEVSHIAGGGRTGGAGYLDESNWKPACHGCGQWLEHHKLEAIALGHHKRGFSYETKKVRRIE